MFSPDKWLANPSTGFYGHTIDQSLRFEDGDSAYLSRTPSSAGNRKTWTWSGWVKRGNLSTGNQNLFRAAVGGNSDRFLFDGSDRLWMIWSDTTDGSLLSTKVFRDTSSWYHIVMVSDTTQSTAANRFKMYVNGEEITGWTTAAYPSQNRDGGINNTVTHNIGTVGASQFFDGYLAEINFIDGTALTPASFGETKDGIWTPKDTSGLRGSILLHMKEIVKLKLYRV